MRCILLLLLTLTNNVFAASITDQLYYNHPKANAQTKCSDLLASMSMTPQRYDQGAYLVIFEFGFNGSIHCSKPEDKLLKLKVNKALAADMGLPTEDFELDMAQLKSKHTTYSREHEIKRFTYTEKYLVIEGKYTDFIFLHDDESNLIMKFNQEPLKELRKKHLENFYWAWKKSRYFGSESSNTYYRFTNWGCKVNITYNQGGDAHKVELNFFKFSPQSTAGSFWFNEDSQSIYLHGQMDFIKIFKNGTPQNDFSAGVGLPPKFDLGFLKTNDKTSHVEMIKNLDKLRASCTSI